MHISVLLEEVIEVLNLREDSIVLDATLGYAGHSSEILKRIKRGYLFAFDQDQNAILKSQEKLQDIGSNFTIIKRNFKYLKEEVQNYTTDQFDGILFDLGVSSPQLDEDSRGFSYHKDARLDMRMDTDQDFSAYDVVNSYSEEALTDIFFRYGEDAFAKNIAKHIVRARADKPIETTLELVEVIKQAVPYKVRLQKHPARQIFQAIRIEVNHELDILEGSLQDAASLLTVGGRLAVITFHSLEDKIVKKLFKKLTEVDALVKGMPNVPDVYLPDYKLVTTKAIVPGKQELEHNSRSRSAKLRVIERIR